MKDFDNFNFQHNGTELFSLQIDVKSITMLENSHSYTYFAVRKLRSIRLGNILDEFQYNAVIRNDLFWYNS